jgi:hypothetical protein
MDCDGGDAIDPISVVLLGRDVRRAIVDQPGARYRRHKEEGNIEE